MGEIGSELPLFVDSDNALGAPFGDVDDGFAVAALMKQRDSIFRLSTVFGNTFEPWVYKNHRSLAEVCEFDGPIVRGAATWWASDSEASCELANANESIRVLAIGPMTNVALALRRNPDLAKTVQELIFVGTNFSVPLPAWRFFDFNHWKDPKALRAVFNSDIRLTCIPCNIARRLRIRERDLEEIPGKLGEFLRFNSRRWFTRARLLKRSERVPIWDLVAAVYALEPELFSAIDTGATLGRAGDVNYGRGEERQIKVVIDFEPAKLWDAFIRYCRGGK